jgi:hypothetical protein
MRCTKGILKDYAIGGAVATIYYTEPFATKDIDIFFIPPEKDKLILLTPFYDFLLKKGYKIYKKIHYDKEHTNSVYSCNY